MRQAGFTLMETLVALVIFSLASMALLELYSRSARAKAAHDSMLERTARAQELLLDIDLNRAFDPSRTGTDADGSIWQVSMSPVGAGLVQVDIRVTDRAGREARIRTLRLPAELGLEPQP